MIDPTWFYFAAARIAVICYVADRRMNLLRVLGLFCVYEAIYYYLVHIAIWYSHPAVSDGTVMTLATASLIILTIGLPAVVLFKLVSRLQFFRGAATMTTTWGRSLLIIPMLIGVSALETFIINRGGSNTMTNHAANTGPNMTADSTAYSRESP
jgi:hypothetical protein